MNELTLIVTYRNRPKLLKIFLAQWVSQYSRFCDLILIEDADKPSNINLKDGTSLYIYVKSESAIFHKSKLINIAIAKVKTKFFLVYDIDLVSYNNALEKHLKFSKSVMPNVMAGYRLNVSLKRLNMETSRIRATAISSENMSSALLKYLLQNERFGVNPIYQTQAAQQINGFNERFVGWGCEDQEFLERYLEAFECSLFQTYDLVYFHINHKHEDSWKTEEIVKTNRQVYYSNKKIDGN